MTMVYVGSQGQLLSLCDFVGLAMCIAYVGICQCFDEVCIG